MLHPKMLRIADIHQPMIFALTIRMIVEVN